MPINQKGLVAIGDVQELAHILARILVMVVVRVVEVVEVLALIVVLIGAVVAVKVEIIIRITLCCLKR